MARPPIEEPTVVVSEFGQDETESNHPAFGQITLHKIQGTSVLYGSDFVHHGCVRVAIHESKLNRSLSHDWYFARSPIIEVDLSEAQWATFVSSFNIGAGVPCTLRYVRNDEVPIKPYLPDPDIRREFSDEVAQTLKDATLTLYKLKEKIKQESIKLPKKTQAELIDPIETVIREITQNIPFVQRSFDKHVEDSIEKAKVEVHAHVNNVLAHAGLEHLQGQVLQIGKSDGTKEDL